MYTLIMDQMINVGHLEDAGWTAFIFSAGHVAVAMSRLLLWEVSSPLIQVTTTGSFWPTDQGHYYEKFPTHWSMSLLQNVSGPLILITTTGSFQLSNPGIYYEKFLAHWTWSLLRLVSSPLILVTTTKFPAHWSRSLLQEVSVPLILITSTRSFQPTYQGYYHGKFLAQ